MSCRARARPLSVLVLSSLAILGCDCGASTGGGTGGGSGAGSGNAPTTGGSGGDGTDQGPPPERPEPAHVSAEPGRLAVSVRGGPTGDVDIEQPAKHPRSCWHYSRSDGETALYATTPKPGAESTDVSVSLPRKGAGIYRIGEDAEGAPETARLRVRMPAKGRKWLVVAEDVTAELTLEGAEGHTPRMRAVIEGDVDVAPLSAEDTPSGGARLEAEITVPWGPCLSGHSPSDLGAWKGRGGQVVGEAVFTDDRGEHNWAFHAPDVSREARDTFVARPEAESEDELAFVIWSHVLETLDYPTELPAPEQGSGGRGRSAPRRVDVTYAVDGEVVTKRGRMGRSDTLEVELRSFDRETRTLTGRFAGKLGRRGRQDAVELRDGRFEVQLPPSR